MTDRYEKIRNALAKGPTSPSAGNQELIIYLTYKDEYGLPEYYCTVRGRLGGGLGVEANAALIAACDADTIRALLAERDQLAAALEAAREALAAMVSWFPSADTYRRLGFDPKTPMQVLKRAKALLSKGS